MRIFAVLAAFVAVVIVTPAYGQWDVTVGGSPATASAAPAPTADHSMTMAEVQAEVKKMLAHEGFVDYLRGIPQYRDILEGNDGPHKMQWQLISEGVRGYRKLQKAFDDYVRWQVERDNAQDRRMDGHDKVLADHEKRLSKTESNDVGLAIIACVVIIGLAGLFIASQNR